MAQLQGQVLSTSVNSAQLVADVDSKVYRLDPDSTPLCCLMNAIGTTRTVENTRYSVMQQQLFNRFLTTTGYTDVATSALNVSDSTVLVVGNLLQNKQTGEVMRVTVINGATSIDVSRAIGETAAAAGTNGDTLVVIGNTYAEFADTPSSNARQLDESYNYTQIFRRSMSVANTLQSIKQWTGSEVERQMMELGMEFAIDQELSALFGQRYSSGGTRTSRGLIKAIATNTYNVAAAALTEAAFETNFLEPLFRYGSSKKILLASPKVCSIFDVWGRSKLWVGEPATETTLGVKVKEYVSTHGSLMVVRHKLLQGVYNGYAVAVDPSYFRRVVLKGRGPKLLKNRQGNGIDGVIHEYLAEIGWDTMREEAHGLMYGATGGAA